MRFVSFFFSVGVIIYGVYGFRRSYLVWTLDWTFEWTLDLTWDYIFVFA